MKINVDTFIEDYGPFDSLEDLTATYNLAILMERFMSVPQERLTPRGQALRDLARARLDLRNAERRAFKLRNGNGGKR